MSDNNFDKFSEWQEFSEWQKQQPKYKKKQKKERREKERREKERQEKERQEGNQFEVIPVSQHGLSLNIFNKTKEISGENELSGNEAYLMVNDRFIPAEEIFFELNTKPTPTQPASDLTQPESDFLGGKIKNMMIGDFGFKEEELGDENLAHSEQIMIAYLMDRLKLGDNGMKVKIFTGRPCCPFCYEAIQRFKNIYKDKIELEVVDFWYGKFTDRQIPNFWNNEKEPDINAIKSYYSKQEAGKGLSGFKEEYTGAQYIKQYYSNNIFKNIEDIDIDTLEKFNNEINKKRRKEGNQITNNVNTIESLKGGTNNPTPVIKPDDGIKKLRKELDQKIEEFKTNYSSFQEKIGQLKKSLEQLKNDLEQLEAQRDQITNLQQNKLKELQEQAEKKTPKQNQQSEEKQIQIKIKLDTLKEQQKKLNDNFKTQLEEAKEAKKELETQKTNIENANKQLTKAIINKKQAINVEYPLNPNAVSAMLEDAYNELRSLEEEHEKMFSQRQTK